MGIPEPEDGANRKMVQSIADILDMFKRSTQLRPWRGAPTGEGLSTARDLLRFLQSLNAGRLIPLNLLVGGTRNQTH